MNSKLAALACLIGCAAQAQIRPTSISVPPVVIYDFANGSMQVEVVATASIKTTDMPYDRGVAVRQALDLPAVYGWSKREMLLINGGSATGSTDRPEGLLVSSGNTASFASQKKLSADPKSDCEMRRRERLKLAGLLCVAEADQIRIGPFSNEAAATCRHAVQSGPLLVENNRATVCPTSPNERPSYRTVACTSGQQVKIIVTEKPIDLFELSKWLATDANGPRCDWALSLGDNFGSGAFYSPRNAYQLNKKSSFHGLGVYPVPSFIVVRQR